MTNNKQQTAVEWLIEKISSSKYFYNLMEEIESRGTTVQPNGILQQAKSMEKEQIINAWWIGNTALIEQISKQFFNETYGGDK
jgi:hypothetical protein